MFGSARYLQQLGFPALATTSAGFAFSQGLPDCEGALTCERNLAYIADIARAVDVPVNADFAVWLRRVTARCGRQCRALHRGRASQVCRSRMQPAIHRLRFTSCRSRVERVRAAREAIDQSHADVMLTARAECFLVGHHDALRESVKRLEAFAEAGADVLFAPGPHDPTAIKALVDAVRPEANQCPGGSGQWLERRRQSRRSACDASVSGARWLLPHGPVSRAQRRS